MKNTVKIEARLNRNITRSVYGNNKVYKKGTVIWDCTEAMFSKLTETSISNHTDLCICEGHGVYEYFDLETDIEFIRVEVVQQQIEKLVTLKPSDNRLSDKKVDKIVRALFPAKKKKKKVKK